MNHLPNASLNLSLPFQMNQYLNLDLVLEPSSSSSSSSSPHGSPTTSEIRAFSCTYCQRKFHSSQALGGHQNANKLERTLARKSRESDSGIHTHGGFHSPRNHRQSVSLAESHRLEVYDSREEFSHLDLSLRL